MQSMLFTVFLVQGQRETPGLAPPMQWALKRVEHAPSATRSCTLGMAMLASTM